ncbi:MAG: TlpA family protein disulfide reductase [Acidimicrobiia bacterium]|nr:TlpA family protein disulfide reductase [Acidimicrobiia bacterium]
MTTAAPTDRSSRGFLLIVAAIVVVGLLAVAVVATNRDGDATGEQTAIVEVDGVALVELPPDVQITDVASDPAAGTVAPTLAGTDFGGTEVSIAPDGRPKVVYFLAHWCPHCQEEVPVVQQLIDDGQVPDGLDLYAVSTAVDAGRSNYPPEGWLADEGFTPLTLRDDTASAAFRAYGGSGFPYVVYLDGDNRVLARSAGNLPADAILSLWASTAIG